MRCEHLFSSDSKCSFSTRKRGKLIKIFSSFRFRLFIYFDFFAALEPSRTISRLFHLSSFTRTEP